MVRVRARHTSTHRLEAQQTQCSARCSSTRSIRTSVESTADSVLRSVLKHEIDQNALICEGVKPTAGRAAGASWGTSPWLAPEILRVWCQLIILQVSGQPGAVRVVSGGIPHFTRGRLVVDKVMDE
jgi:hypothetical protein